MVCVWRDKKLVLREWDPQLFCIVLPEEGSCGVKFFPGCYLRNYRHGLSFATLID